MKLLFSIFLITMSINVSGQNFTIQKDKDGYIIYNGLITFNDLEKEPSFTWLKSGYSGYKPDDKLIQYLSNNLKNYSMVVFMGTWCSDSHGLVPKLEKVLTEANYNFSNYIMYGVDMSKKTTSGNEKTYDISYVPTIILYRGTREAGRITESVTKSIEADLAAIVAKDSGKELPH